MLWFNDLAFPVPAGTAAAERPLFFNGRLFIQGLDGLLCLNAYNGRAGYLGSIPCPAFNEVFDGEHLMGTSGTGSNYCVGPTGLYITGNECLRVIRPAARWFGSCAPTSRTGRPALGALSRRRAIRCSARWPTRGTW